MADPVTTDDIKAAFAADRAEVRAKVLAALADGPASTQKLRSFFPAYSANHKRAVFWAGLSEMERDGVVEKYAFDDVAPEDVPATVLHELSLGSTFWRLRKVVS